MHNTSEKDKIERSKFLSQMGRRGGINFASPEMADLYRPRASHRVVIEFKEALKHGIFFFSEMRSLASPIVLVLGNETLGMESSITMSQSSFILRRDKSRSKIILIPLWLKISARAGMLEGSTNLDLRSDISVGI